MLTVLLGLILLFAFFWIVLLCGRDRQLLLASPITMKVGELERSVYALPPSRGEPERLFIGFHGFGDTPRRFAYYTGLHNVAENDLVMYPQAIKPLEGQRLGWNAGFCCGSGWKQEADDVAFIAKIAEDFKNSYGQDKPVYLLGFSNGGMIAQRVLAEKPNLIDGIAVSGSSAGVQDGVQLEPQSSAAKVLLMHGRQDQTVPFDGGATANEPDFPWLDFDQTTAIWQDALGAWQVQTHVYPDMGHQWADWRIVNVWHTKPEATRRAVEFLMQK